VWKVEGEERREEGGKWREEAGRWREGWRRKVER
jgi:hypothetical protein